MVSMLYMDRDDSAIPLNTSIRYSYFQVTSTHYTIEAQKEHYKFKKLENYMVLPNMASIKDTNAISYNLCGLVRMASGDLKVKSFSAVVGPNGSGKSNVIDAMLFVFGKRAKQMRLNKVSELIHNSTNHQNLDSAGVSVHFQEIVDSMYWLYGEIKFTSAI
ncbi:Structural maintenance of chromosomes protein 4 [Glycine soja]